jgi:hypothetical protein
MQLKIESFENEIFLRVNSLLLEAEKHRENYRSQMIKYKEYFSRYT